MRIATVIAVGLDASFIANQRSIWQSAGYYVTPVRSIEEAIAQFTGGDFDRDLVKLRGSILFIPNLSALSRYAGEAVPHDHPILLRSSHRTKEGCPHYASKELTGFESR